MLHPVRSTQFKRDYKLAKKRGKNLSKLTDIMDKLMNEEVLAPKYKDHKLTGDYIGCRECHIEPDWLLVYSTTAVEIFFIRTGTHSDLFGT
jgi:mRNA interferase YafQ